jgi:hypothetical protein
MNYRIVEFLQLLDDYRKRCEESGLYTEADKSFSKALEIK